MKKNILKTIFSLFFAFIFLFTLKTTVSAQTSAPSENISDSIFGEIEEPAGIDKFNEQAGPKAKNMGLLIFISNILKLISLVAGIYTLFNFIFAGFTYITSSGDSSAYAKIGEKLSLSVTGLVLIVASYTIAGIIGLIIFGDASYIINPQIPTI